ncbi:hypothetical protein L2E82_35704 [Cichorium intybus]|uniref:Uncharacterized protein n=1 Tax=Cichorium intybus TaxID=13427 RepID=A0ACB9BPK5_CICIN|nr:hypothetical protein L2E82_35704 [Cichorium intybus]
MGSRRDLLRGALLRWPLSRRVDCGWWVGSRSIWRSGRDLVASLLFLRVAIFPSAICHRAITPSRRDPIGDRVGISADATLNFFCSLLGSYSASSLSAKPFFLCSELVTPLLQPLRPPDI